MSSYSPAEADDDGVSRRYLDLEDQDNLEDADKMTANTAPPISSPISAMNNTNNPFFQKVQEEAKTVKSAPVSMFVDTSQAQSNDLVGRTSHSSPASSNRNSLHPPTIVSPKRNRGMSLRSQLLNKTLENNLRAAYNGNSTNNKNGENYTENIELQSNISNDKDLTTISSTDPTLVGSTSKRKQGSNSLKRFSTSITSTTSGLSSKKTPPHNKKKQKTYSINRLIESIKYSIGLKTLFPTKSGRKIPLTLQEFDFDRFCDLNPQFSENFNSEDIKFYFNGKENLLIDERSSRPHISNRIVSSRYNIINFIPKQLYAQFSKLANIYFMTIAIMQLVPNWSTTGTSTTIIPLSIFISISIAREGIDDLRRHSQDKQENFKKVRVLEFDPKMAEKQFLQSNINNRHSVISQLSERSDNSTTELNVDFNDSNSIDSRLGNGHNNANHTYTSVDVHAENSFNNIRCLNKCHIHEKKIDWQDLSVGSIIKLGQDEPVPADIIILTSDNENSEVFVETMDLDGETNLKTKVPHAEVDKATNQASKLAKINGIITTEDPNQDLYGFEGHLIINNNKYPLTNDNIAYRGSIIRNTNSTLGIVVFNGEESKIRMNAIKNPRTKAPHLQRSINFIIAFMILVVVGLSVGSFVTQKVLYNRVKNKYSYLLKQDVGSMPTFMSFIIMYNTLIPLSLYVTMELIKVGQLLFLQYDVDLYYPLTNTPAEAKTATILEELGQVSYVFSDKTGTLTDNLMIFRKFSIGGIAWNHNLEEVLEDMGHPEDQSNHNLKPFITGPATPTISAGDFPNSNRSSYDILTSSRGSSDFSRKESIDIRRGTGTVHYTGRPSMAAIDLKSYNSNHASLKRTKSSASATSLRLDSPKLSEEPTLRSSIELIYYIQTNPTKSYSQKAKFFILSLALCHTCFPKRLIKESQDSAEEVEYQSSSPDELALVSAARDMGFVVFDKKQNTLVLKTYPNGLDKAPITEYYIILDIIEFNSVRKRMTCIVQFPNGKKCLICKGADNVILQRLKPSYKGNEASEKIARNSKIRKEAEAEYVINERNSNSMELFRNDTIHSIRKSMTLKRSNTDRISTDLVNGMLTEKERISSEIDRIAAQSRQSLHLDQIKRYGLKNESSGNSPIIGNSIDDYITDENLFNNNQYVAEKTLEHIDNFSTDGLRTLLYGYKWLSEEDYNDFSREYYEAKTALVDRQLKMEEIGEKIENDLDLCGATAIEDKLQEGVPDAIDKIHRAGIKMWMLTGDKRETAINIGYSCGLIKNVSTVVILNSQEDDDSELVAKMEAAILEINKKNVAHCVCVIDGTTLQQVENDVTMMNMFVEFGCVADAVICCRASPSQKAKLVSVVKTKYKRQVTLAIGDGANDIAMIQSADIGIGITGKEGLQAARSSDYSIAQFRFLIKLLLVHGRYNYVRTTKFVLFTFYKEFMFYLSQVVYQRNTLFTGTSLYEPWSLSMFNTLFTSLPVLCIGIFEKDLRPATLIANPALYRQGRESLSFNFPIFAYYMISSTLTSVMVTLLSWELWGETALKDNTIMPNGVMTFIVFTILINVKCQMLDMRNRNIFAFASVIIETIGVIAWNYLISGLYKDDTSLIYYVQVGITQEFGLDITWWAALFFLLILGLLTDIISKVLRNWWFPTAVDYFQEFEKNFILRNEFEKLSYKYLKQSWEFKKDENFSKLKNIGNKVLARGNNDAESNNAESISSDTLGSQSKYTYDENNKSIDGIIDETDPKYRIHVLPSGKVHRRRVNDTKLTKFGKKIGFIEDDLALNNQLHVIGDISEEDEEDDDDEEINAIMRNRMDDETFEDSLHK